MRRIKLFETFEVEDEYYKNIENVVVDKMLTKIISLTDSEIEMITDILGNAYSISTREVRNAISLTCKCDKNEIDIFKIEDEYYLVGLIEIDYHYYSCDQIDGLTLLLNEIITDYEIY